METVSKPFNGKNYWKKNGYTLLNGATTKRKIRVVQIKGDGENGVKRKRFWNLKKAPKLLTAVMRPQKLWEKLRDGYMSMTMKMAGDVGRADGGNELFGKKMVGPSRKTKVPSKQRLENFENRLVLEIYKSLATSRGVSEV